jgi:hypothetical protein
VDVVEEILAQLKRQRRGAREVVREHLELAKRYRPPPAHYTDRKNQDARVRLAKKAYDTLAKLRPLVEDPEHLIAPGSRILQALLLWSAQADPRIDWRQREAAMHAILILEHASFDQISTAQSGNLHSIMVLVHEVAFGPLTGDAAGLDACRMVLHWHREAISAESDEIA